MISFRHSAFSLSWTMRVVEPLQLDCFSTALEGILEAQAIPWNVVAMPLTQDSERYLVAGLGFRPTVLQPGSWLRSCPALLLASKGKQPWVLLLFAKKKKAENPLGRMLQWFTHLQFQQHSKIIFSRIGHGNSNDPYTFFSRMKRTKNLDLKPKQWLGLEAFPTPAVGSQVVKRFCRHPSPDREWFLAMLCWGTFAFASR